MKLIWFSANLDVTGSSIDPFSTQFDPGHSALPEKPISVSRISWTNKTCCWVARWVLAQKIIAVNSRVSIWTPIIRSIDSMIDRFYWEHFDEGRYEHGRELFEHFSRLRTFFFHVPAHPTFSTLFGLYFQNPTKPER